MLQWIVTRLELVYDCEELLVHIVLATFAVGDSSLDSLQNLQKARRVAFADSPLLSTECRVIIQVSVCIVRVYFIRWPW